MNPALFALAALTAILTLYWAGGRLADYLQNRHAHALAEARLERLRRMGRLPRRPR